MKKLFFFFLLVTACAFSSCEKSDPCSSVSCFNGGVCVNGTCDCPPGFSGSQCQTQDLCYGITCLNGGTCANGLCNCPTGFSGSNCATMLTPVSMTITRIDVETYPVTTTSGGGWDVGSGSDPYLTFSLGTSSASADFITGYGSDATGSTLYYTLSTPKIVTNLSSNWALGMWDYDTTDPDDLMGGIYFKPIDEITTVFPSSFYVSNATFSFKLYVTWNF